MQGGEERGFVAAVFFCGAGFPVHRPSLGSSPQGGMLQSTKANTLVPFCQTQYLQFTECEILAHGNKANVRKGSRLGGHGGAGHSKDSCDYHRLWD